MNSYWVTFQGRAAGCVDAEDADTALRTAARFGSATSAAVLPHPAMPRLVQHSHCPAFCIHPDVCKGRRSCPRRYACSE